MDLYSDAARAYFLTACYQVGPVVQCYRCKYRRGAAGCKKKGCPQARWGGERHPLQPRRLPIQEARGRARAADTVPGVRITGTPLVNANRRGRADSDWAIVCVDARHLLAVVFVCARARRRLRR